MIRAFTLLTLFCTSASAATCFGSGDLTSPDGAVTARITRTGHGGCGESRVELYEADGHLLTIADYTSAEGDSGDGVYQAAWSADSRYLVFSHARAGARQPRFVLDVYTREGNKLRPLQADLPRPDFNFTGAGAVEVDKTSISLP